jgi:hypothetical protein
LDTVVFKLEQAKTICRGREAEGFYPEELEFEYEFVAASDCCRHCESIDGSVYRGPFILSEFPYAQQMDSEVWLAHYHMNCRCVLRLVNKFAAFMALLYRDLVVVEG